MEIARKPTSKKISYIIMDISYNISKWESLAKEPQSKKLPSGLDALCHDMYGYWKRIRKPTKKLLNRATLILDLETKYSKMSDLELKNNIIEKKDIFTLERDSDDDLNHAFAMIREVAWRIRKEKPYLVQVAGGLALNQGFVAEMATGEGKTLTATMPVIVAAWRGKGCHVITANEYLAKRDAEAMAPIYKFCGLSVAHLEQKFSPDQRQKAYQADITYCTNGDVAADFLRDQLTLGRNRSFSSVLVADLINKSSKAGSKTLIQRGLAYAIIDEIDSILIDEAVTPLIISGDAPNPEQLQVYKEAAELVKKLIVKKHYILDKRRKSIELTTEGERFLKQTMTEKGGMWRGKRRREELALQALNAKEFFLRDEQYVIKDNKVVIVDEATGRLMPDRTWRHGLHQIVEAKECLEGDAPKEVYARISFQRFFRLYDNLCGMTGTASEAWKELWKIYQLPVVPIPTNRPCRREVLPDIICSTQEEKWRIIIQRIRVIHALGQPILIGTKSVASSKHLSSLLTAVNLEHQLLNAENDEKEAEIIAQAGEKGKITVATNMAGRGTDIKLGKGVNELGGLFVLASEKHESARIDRQLIGR